MLLVDIETGHIDLNPEGIAIYEAFAQHLANQDLYFESIFPLEHYPETHPAYERFKQRVREVITALDDANIF